MSMDQRYFLKLTGGSTLGLFAYGMLGGCETLLEADSQPPDAQEHRYACQ